MKKVLVCGAGGFIGGHLVKRLKKDGAWVRAVDIKYHDYVVSPADEFIKGDLRDPLFVKKIFDEPFDEVYQLAADMGGAGFVFSGENDADIMHNSAMINLNVVEASVVSKVKKIFYSSSACMYPERNQMDPKNPNCAEDSAYPAQPDSEYGWEKLFSERFYMAAKRNYKLDIRIARFHNIFGPEGSWNDGREKAPAAFCRKVAETPNGGEIEMWGDGQQTRSFLYVDECIEGVLKLMNSHYNNPINIGSDEMIQINDLAKMVMKIAGKNQKIIHISGPLGVRGRNSDNKLIKKVLNWVPNMPLKDGLEKTYQWVLKQVNTNI
ncbi:MAG: NAD-dependent dehydratase [Candidatus Marinimicrobia bacterium]|nr:NAD-dependent dehydratase [Candidatus Neomarinimicrobiota bacterium]|tara:strand:- start:400 stop:1365 length:966 start_codon:yes stop_codon:yes gene_type:complete